MPFLNDMLDEIHTKNEAAKAAVEEEQAVEAVSPLVTRFKFDVRAIVRALRRNILGQDRAVDAIEEVLKVVRADITDPDRPLFVCLFLGPTGVGKTESVRILAEAIHGDRNDFCRVDMNTLSQEHYSAALTGAPPGYVGSREGSTVLDEEKIQGSFSRPGIVLFDEIEKASSEVVQALLNVFDTGVMKVASGEKTIDFRNAMIFMTSNIAARDIQKQARRRNSPWARFLPGSGSRKAMDRIAEKRLLDKFPPEFVNRIDNITTFNWIEGDLVEELVNLEVARLNRRLVRHHVRVRLDAGARHYIAQTGFDRRFGARALKRALRRHLEVPLAEFLLSDAGAPGSEGAPLHYVAALDDGELSFVRDPEQDTA